MHLLETSGLTKRFGGLTVMNDLDFSMEEGEIKGFLGPNGAGKSTFFNLITGVLTPSSGIFSMPERRLPSPGPIRWRKWALGGRSSSTPCSVSLRYLRTSPRLIICAPIPRCPRFSSTPKPIAPTKSTSPNPQTRFWNSWASSMCAMSWPRTCPTAIRRSSAWPGLGDQAKLLLLDEPLGGMNPEEIAFSIDAISKLRDKGISILVVEHNMQILDILDSVTVISFGHKIFEGTPEEMRKDPTVIETYFGRYGMSNILEIQGLKVMYGKSVAIHDVNISVPQGGIVTLIGSNGAGKIHNPQYGVGPGTGNGG